MGFNEIEKKKILKQLGFDAPSASELIKREDFKDERSYLAALADMAAKLENPAVKDAIRKAGRESVDIDVEAERNRQRDEFGKIRKSVKLTERDEQEINSEAARLARADLAAGKITYGDVGGSIEKYAAELTNKKLDSKAAGYQFNMALRGQRLGEDD